ncbi:MAG TPA: hypothetical protein VN285_08930, partial [Candidatus Deferrimicrobium sp.]|nr:hypothetical protein [Candidatus Deferrimicrobium sp.]
MAWQKGRILKTLLIVAASWFFVSPTVDAIDDLNWQTLTSFKDVRRMRLIHDTLWVATSGGLLAVVDPASPGRQYTNVDGLGTVDLTDIIEDSGGQKWVTGHGRLIRFTPADSRQFLFQKDNSLLALNCVTDDGDRLWVGTSIGLVLFSKTSDGGEIVDSYHLFGNL